ncbi:MAG: Fis family transcriptional regulator [Candidatus Parcubacteria bacterium]|nr:MAG: Fis family transcriptional regulator [Candidatus Parcubacteria bacterium]
MLAKIKGATLSGITAEIIEIEVGLLGGLPSFQIVGLADKTIDESKERINLAIKSIGAKPPNKINARVIVNLSPADIKKEGSHLDLPIALAFLYASKQIKSLPSDILFLGELGLDGKLKKIRGALPIVLKAGQYFKAVVVPQDNKKEIQFIKDIDIYCCEDLQEIIDFLEEKRSFSPLSPEPFKTTTDPTNTLSDFSFIIINDYILQGIILSAIGKHNLLLYGPPGTGKTLIAHNLVNLLPDLNYEESLEVSSIYSALGLLQDQLITKPVLRNPHHSSSATAILGGGKEAKPGEVTLSHRGVLFFDELPEFRRDILEGIREPLETEEIVIARAKKTIKYPASFLFVGAYNPCPCGYYGDEQIECKCTIAEINKYQKKISGPILDRIDIYLYVPRINSEKILSFKENNLNQIKTKIIETVEKMQYRYRKENFKYNSKIPVKALKTYCKLDTASENFLKKAIDAYRLSLRSVHKILKLARTIADYNDQENIKLEHLSQALQYKLSTN